MKNLLSIIACVIAIFAVSSCNFFKGEEPGEEQKVDITKVESISQEIKDKIAAQDTLMNALVSKVDTLSKALTQAWNENTELRKRVEKLEKPKNILLNYITFVTLAIAIAAFILSLSRSGVSGKEVDKIFKENLDKSKRIKDLQHDVQKLESKKGKDTLSVNPSISDLDARLSNVEQQLPQLDGRYNYTPNGRPSALSPSREQSSRPQEPEYNKRGYAGINSGSYFTQIFDSSQEGCVFSIEFKAEDKGEFNIISLDKIKSRNGWEAIVECAGCSISDATRFNVERPGACEKHGDMWKVSEKLKIKLSL